MRLHVIEPRNPDGTLNLKMPMVPEGSGFGVEFVTDEQLTDFYFRKNPEAKTVDFKELHRWYRELGYSIRLKTW